MTSITRDEEFRRLFAEEAEKRLSSLSRHLLELEKTGSAPDLVASLFRDAHTLKGSAAVVGIDDVARVAHAMESVLEPLRSGASTATPELVDALLEAVDGLSLIIDGALRGESGSRDAEALERRLTRLTSTTGVEPVAEEARQHPVAPAVVRQSETVMVPVQRLDELVRLVGESAAAQLRLGRLLGDRLGVDPSTLSEFRDLSRVLNELQQHATRARMVTVATITDSLHRAVRDLARALDKDVRWEVRGADTELDRNVLQRLSDPLLHLVRNAVDHGIESIDDRLSSAKRAQASLLLHAMQLGSEVIITVRDDGRGIDVARVRERAQQQGIDTTAMSDEAVLALIFRSGLSTATRVSDVSGRGVGLDVVRTAVEAVRGRVEVRSEAGRGTEFRIIVPITLAVLPCLLVGVGSERYALPLHSVLLVQAADESLETHADGRPMVWVGDNAIPVSGLADTLWHHSSTGTGGGIIVVLAGGTGRHAFRVDALLGGRDVVVKGVGELLPRADVIAGASVEPDGSILLVVDAAGLISRAEASIGFAHAIASPALGTTSKRGSVLVVDDALIIRELERSILERAGYDVLTAADGVEALNRLAETPVDLVLADVEMPRMDGFALTRAVRADANLANIPVVILTSRASEEDRRAGLDAGADAYIVKSGFDETSLLDTIEKFLGARV